MSIQALRSEIADIPQTDDDSLVKRKSRDMTYSPILREEAKGKLAELIVQPRSKDDVIRVARAAALHKVTIMIRGAGTGDFGQGIPLAGGLVLDMTAMDKILWVKNRTLRAEPGIRMLACDKITQKDGLELRMHPSTRANATLGGFVAGGHVGPGSCTWGILRDIGNILGVEVVSVEEEPKIIELRGEEVNRIQHAYGTNGIITEIEMPLAPAYDWMEAIVDFADFMEAARFGVALNMADGIVVKMIGISSWPFPSFLVPLAKYTREGRHCVHVMVASEFADFFRWMAAEHHGFIAYEGLEGKGDFGSPLYEFNFGHTMLYSRRARAGGGAPLSLFPANNLLGSIESMHARYGHIGPMHLDMKRIDGRIACQGLPNLPYVDAATLARTIEEFQSEGLKAVNTHTFGVHQNGMKPIDDVERAFKLRMDPYDLLNTGKFHSVDRGGTGEGDKLPTSGFYNHALESARS
jgi:FAD binding domain-containing protein